jgi:hypothetical protein
VDLVVRPRAERGVGGMTVRIGDYGVSGFDKARRSGYPAWILGDRVGRGASVSGAAVATPGACQGESLSGNETRRGHSRWDRTWGGGSAKFSQSGKASRLS